MAIEARQPGRSTAQLSARDVDAYEDWDAWMGRLAGIVGPLLDAVPPKLGSKRVGDLLGQARLAAMGASLAGLLIAFYKIGYGLAAFGVGPLQDYAGLSLASIYGATAIVAVVAGLLSNAIVRGRSHATA